MKFNWKILVASVLIVVVMFWAVSSTRPTSYKGATLKFPVKAGSVTVTNASDAPVPVQLVGTGSRTFSVTSDTTGIAGSSAKDANSTSAVQLYAFDLPSGASTFTVVRGTDVNFVAQNDTQLQANVEAMTAGDTRTTGIIAIVVTLGSLFYISRVSGHRWMSALRGVKPIDPLVVPAPTDAPVGDPNRGRDGRMYSNYGSKE